MPELPEVETAKRQLSVLEGFKVKEVVVRKKNNAVIKLKKPVPAKELQFLVGKTLLGVKRRAKYLFLLFDDYCLVCHFGMTGMLHFNNSTNHEVVRLTDSKGNYISYCDTRKFGLIDIVKRSKLKPYIEGLNIGYEPLGSKINADILAEMLEKSNKPIKEWLLDQSKIAGIGNIYASEICFAIKVHPFEKACNCVAKAGKMLTATIKILSAAIEMGGSTINSYASPDGSIGSAQSLHKVYGREGKSCVRCKTGTIVKEMRGRSTFYCDNCQ